MNEDSEFMDISAGFDPFNKAGKNVVVQYQAECERDVECDGGYSELRPTVCEATTLGDPKVYSSKLGPGKCDYTKPSSSCKGRKVVTKADLLCKQAWSAPADAPSAPVVIAGTWDSDEVEGTSIQMKEDSKIFGIF